MSSRIRIVSNSTSGGDTLMSPATTSPLSRTRSRTSTSPVDRPCPSDSDVGIVWVFYGNHPAGHSRLSKCSETEWAGLSQQCGCHEFVRVFVSNDARLHYS